MKGICLIIKLLGSISSLKVIYRTLPVQIASDTKKIPAKNTLTGNQRGVY